MPAKTSSATTATESDMQQVMVEAVRTQLAATSAALKFWSAFATEAQSYTDALSREVERAGGIGSSDSSGRIADLSRDYLRRLAELPAAAAKQFRDEVDEIVAKKTRPSRSARAKS